MFLLRCYIIVIILLIRGGGRRVEFAALPCYMNKYQGLCNLLLRKEVRKETESAKKEYAIRIETKLSPWELNWLKPYPLYYFACHSVCCSGGFVSSRKKRKSKNRGYLQQRDQILKSNVLSSVFCKYTDKCSDRFCYV